MFDILDTDKSGSISRQEMKDGLSKLGLSLSASVAADVIESMDTDRNEYIDRIEFEIWMELDVSRLQVSADHVVAICRMSAQAI